MERNGIKDNEEILQCIPMFNDTDNYNKGYNRGYTDGYNKALQDIKMKLNMMKCDNMPPVVISIKEDIMIR